MKQLALGPLFFIVLDEWFVTCPLSLQGLDREWVGGHTEDYRLF